MKVTMHFEEYPANKPQESREYLTLESDRDGYHDVRMASYDKDKDEWYVINKELGHRVVIYDIYGWDSYQHMPKVRTDAGKIWFGSSDNFSR